jgi:hypothetical protein
MSTDMRTEKQKALDASVLERVKRGIALLDKEYGHDWPNKINLDTLDLTKYHSCVLGQLYADAEPTKEQLAAWQHGIEYGYDPDSGYYKGVAIIDGALLHKQSQADHGFTEGRTEDNGFWSTLQKTWQQEINRLQLERAKEGMER